MLSYGYEYTYIGRPRDDKFDKEINVSEKNIGKIIDFKVIRDGRNIVLYFDDKIMFSHCGNLHEIKYPDLNMSKCVWNIRDWCDSVSIYCVVHGELFDVIIKKTDDEFSVDRIHKRRKRKAPSKKKYKSKRKNIPEIIVGENKITKKYDYHTEYYSLN